MKKLLTSLLVIVLFSTISLIMAQDDTIADIVEDTAESDDAEFTILLELLEESDFIDTLDDDELEFTVFAPTDEAFEDLLDELELELEDLLDDEDRFMDILLYHVLEGIVEADDFEDEQAFETLHGGSIIGIFEDKTLIINDVAEAISTDVEANNGIIHIIDTVLIPAIEPGEPCFISTDTVDGVSVHVGPGNNRTSVTFLDIVFEYQALGQNEDNEGTIWYQLDKEEAAPGRSINEAWVSSEEVDTTGDCDTVGETSAPPIVPITNRPPSNDSDDAVDSNDTPADTVITGSRPSSGTYTVSLATFTNASCAGGSNIPIPSADFWTNTSFSTFVSSSSSSMTFDGDILTFSGGAYSGQILIDGEYYTTYAYPSNSNSFTGTIIVSFVSGGENCSGSVNFFASR